MKNIVCQLYYCKMDFKVKYIWEKDVFNEMTCKKSLISNIIYGRRHSKVFNNTLYVTALTVFHVNSTDKNHILRLTVIFLIQSLMVLILLLFFFFFSSRILTSFIFKKKTTLVQAYICIWSFLTATHFLSELKTLEWDILNPDLIINLEIKFMRTTSNI